MKEVMLFILLRPSLVEMTNSCRSMFLTLARAFTRGKCENLVITIGNKSFKSVMEQQHLARSYFYSLDLLGDRSPSLPSKLMP